MPYSLINASATGLLLLVTVKECAIASALAELLALIAKVRNRGSSVLSTEAFAVTVKESEDDD